MTIEELRARAAIAALPKCIETVETVLLRGGRIEGTIAEQASYTAVMYADALVEKFIGVLEKHPRATDKELKKIFKEL